MSLEDLEIVMFQQLHQTKGSMDMQAAEIPLAGFEGYCHQCKQQGHKADACPNWNPLANGERTANSGEKGGRGGCGDRGRTRFLGNCQNCSMQGHMEQNCWLKL
jgi:hypothetical protein